MNYSTEGSRNPKLDSDKETKFYQNIDPQWPRKDDFKNVKSTHQITSNWYVLTVNFNGVK
jgi:hypothetical protein